MKKYKIIIVCLVLSMLSIHSLYSQKAFYFGPEIEANQSDTLMFHLKEYTGDIQWQHTYDGTNWIDIIGETSDILLYQADSTVHVRAKVTAGNCPDYFSDTKYVSVSKLTENAFHVDSTDLELVSDTIDIQQGIFSYIGEDVQQIDTGIVLIGSEGEGYLRKVTQVNSLKNNAITVETEQATLEDIFEYLDITDSTKLVMSDDKAFIGGTPVPVEVLYTIPGAKHSKGVLVFGDEVSFTIEDFTLTITEGTLKFEPTLIKKVKLGLTKVKELKIALKGEIEHNIKMQISAGKEISAEKTITLAKYKTGPYFLAGAPIFIEYSIKACFNASLGGSISVDMGYNSKITTKVGAKYKHDEDPKWNTIWDNQASFTPFIKKPEFGISLGAGFSVVPGAFMKIAATQGPYINLEPYINAGIDVTGLNWEFGVTAGLNANLGYKVEIFGEELANYYATLPVLEYPIYNTGGQNEAQPPNPVINHEPGNIGPHSVTISGYCEAMEGAPVTEKGFYYNTSANPHLNNGTHISLGEGEGGFTKNIYGLTTNTTYYVRAYAENSAGRTYATSDITFKTKIPEFSPDTLITDVDGNTYNTIKIGNQIWMAENLKVTKYSNHDPIVLNTNAPSAWSDSIGVYAHCDNNPQWTDYYGLYYNWHAINDDRNVCPEGFEVPSDTAWKELVVYLGAVPLYTDSYEANNIGAMLKDTRVFPYPQPRWNAPNYANNITGFSILPGGANSWSGGSSNWLGKYGLIWSKSLKTDNSTVKIYTFLNSNESFSTNYWWDIRNLYPIRCVKTISE